MSISSRSVHRSEDAILAAFSWRVGTILGAVRSLERSEKGMREGKAADSIGLLVSADGLEPSTHALKERAISDLPRIFNNLRSREALQIGTEGWWSGLNKHFNKHRYVEPDSDHFGIGSLG